MQPFLNDFSIAFPAINFQQAEFNTASFEVDASSLKLGVSGRFPDGNQASYSFL
jgi:hypothetical protein